MSDDLDGGPSLWDQFWASPTTSDDDVELAAGGARVAWDHCGCGGYCGFDWYSPEEEARMLAAGTPDVGHTKRRQGALSLWTNDAGGSLIVAVNCVRWGGVIDG